MDSEWSKEKVPRVDKLLSTKDRFVGPTAAGETFSLMIQDWWVEN
jgi:hypothetical protein